MELFKSRIFFLVVTVNAMVLVRVMEGKIIIDTAGRHYTKITSSNEL